jgi:hypothetical protein
MTDYEAIYDAGYHNGPSFGEDQDCHGDGLRAVVAAAKTNALNDSIQYVDATSFAHMTRAEVLSMMRTFAEWQASQ